MPVKQRKAKGRAHKITAEAVAAWKAADYSGLHRALGLHPWEASPLPEEITSLGVSEETAASVDPDSTYGFEDSYAVAVALQRELIAAAGWPNCRAAYADNLREAQGRARYCVEQVAHPDRGGGGTGCDLADRQAALESALDEVAYRQDLLDELGPA